MLVARRLRPVCLAVRAKTWGLEATQAQSRRHAVSAKHGSGRGRRRSAPSPAAACGAGHWLQGPSEQPAQLPPSLRRLGLEAGELALLLETGRREGPAGAYRRLVQTGSIQPDDGQAACARELQSFWESLRDHQSAVALWEKERCAWAAEHVAWKSAHLAWQEAEADRKRQAARQSEQAGASAGPSPTAEPQEPVEPARPALATYGRYVWGGVGGGKSLLMDLFVECCRAAPCVGRPVRRIHFHEFMHGVHRNLHELRQAGVERTTRAVARGIAERVRLLAFDEFQITNISDALIIETLLDSLFLEDVAIVMTSNREPEELYKDGLNRHLAIPQLLSLFARRAVPSLQLCAARDFRVSEPARRGAGVGEAAGGAWRDFFCKGDVSACGPAGSRLRAAFVEAAGADFGLPATVPIAWGRTLDVSEAASGVGMFTFGELCGRALNADDYLSLARQFHTVVVADVPLFNLEQHDEARRFTNLIDCLYESHARLVVSADGPPERILSTMEVLAGVSLAGVEDGAARPSAGAAPPAGPSDWIRHNPFSPEPASITQAIRRAASGPNDAAAGNDDANTGIRGVAGVMAGAVGSLQESGFAAKRATSRLLHMQSNEYLQAHRRERLEE